MGYRLGQATLSLCLGTQPPSESRWERLGCASTSPQLEAPGHRQQHSPRMTSAQVSPSDRLSFFLFSFFLFLFFSFSLTLCLSFFLLFFLSDRLTVSLSHRLTVSHCLRW